MAVGVPLAFTHEDFLVLSNKNRLMFNITKKKNCSENREISTNCVTVIRKCQWLSFIKYNDMIFILVCLNVIGKMRSCKKLNLLIELIYTFHNQKSNCK